MNKAQQLVNLASEVADELRAHSIGPEPITVAELVDALDYCVPYQESVDYPADVMAQDVLERIRQKRIEQKMEG